MCLTPRFNGALAAGERMSIRMFIDIQPLRREESSPPA
jgi:hypothetical protein